MSLISNFDVLATTKQRIDALSIVEEGAKAINTAFVVNNNISLKDGILQIKDQKYNLSDYERVFIIGFGKVSSEAASEIENILGDELDGGIVIDKHVSPCKKVEVYQGTHPLQSAYNVEVSQKIVELAQSLTEKDLAIVIVSGGGSSLLCYPMSEYEQGNEFYFNLLKVGGNIQELNTLRKHVSGIKGGGLVKLLYPATVASLIFCDIPGDHFDEVASGPTYLDTTTTEDAEKILEKYKIQNTFRLNETPKEEKYFSKVNNITFVSNGEALRAMGDEAKKRGYDVISLGNEIYDDSGFFLKKAKKALREKSIVLAGGELSLALTTSGGDGGRNLYVASEAIGVIDQNDLFISFATDGIDNKSIGAGAIVDLETKKKIAEKNLNVEEYHGQNKDSEFFAEIGDMIITGDTGSNVSDIYLMMRN